MAMKRSKTVRLYSGARVLVCLRCPGTYVGLSAPGDLMLTPREAREIGQALLDLADVVEEANADD